MRSQVI